MELRQIETHKNQIILHFSSEGYVRIESSIYQVDGPSEADNASFDLRLKGTTLTLIKKG